MLSRYFFGFFLVFLFAAIVVDAGLIEKPEEEPIIITLGDENEDSSEYSLALEMTKSYIRKTFKWADDTDLVNEAADACVMELWKDHGALKACVRNFMRGSYRIENAHPNEM